MTHSKIKAMFWRLGYWLFSDRYKGISLKECLNFEYVDKCYYGTDGACYYCGNKERG